jgi:hypothetical protein
MWEVTVTPETYVDVLTIAHDGLTTSVNVRRDMDVDVQVDLMVADAVDEFLTIPDGLHGDVLDAARTALHAVR